ncbi:hypothetical protein GN278_03750 [Rhodobacteraceae bacterium Araon29]
MAQARVLVLATLITKAEETNYFLRCLHDHDVTGVPIDLSLDTGGKIVDGPDKLSAMNAAGLRASEAVSKALKEGVQAVIGLGGGTGGEIALKVLRDLPITLPKVLITTLPFDPRNAVADSSIILVPTLADICGLNATLREVLENVAALTAGLCKAQHELGSDTVKTSVGITSLGATEAAVGPLVARLKALGQESTVFHANGFGGAAFSRFIDLGAFNAIVDLTPHELTRLHIAGAHAPMPNRFSAGGDLPRVVLPGALNFVGLGEKSTLPGHYLSRDHYEHSGYFTHAKLTSAEMQIVAELLYKSLNQHKGDVTLIVPMGGFSHQDRPGGSIEDKCLRTVFLDTVGKNLHEKIKLRVLPQHIGEPEVTDAILAALPSIRRDSNV